VTIQRLDVAAGGGPGQGPIRTEGGDVVDRCPHQTEERLAGHTGGGAHPLGLSEQGHQVVGGDARGGVISGPIVVSHGEPLAAEGVHDRAHERIAGEREPRPPQPLGAQLRIGESDEGVNRRTPGMTAEDVQAQRPGEVSDDGALDGLDAGGNTGDRRIGRGDDEDVDAGSSAGGVVVAAERRLDSPAGASERTTQGEAGPTRPDDA